MVSLVKKIEVEDIVRLGAYTQMEGSFSFHPRRGYRFTFYLYQIPDMPDLIGRIVELETPLSSYSGYVQFYSKELYLLLTKYGFNKFKTNNWNIPSVINLAESYKTEYFRAVIDSLGNVDVDRSVPYVRVSSVNTQGLEHINRIFGGKLYKYDDNNYLQWHGKDALAVCESVEWKFYSARNQRGAVLIRNFAWERFIG